MADTPFSAYTDADVQNAAQERLAAGAKQHKTDQSNTLGTAGGILGAIISTVATGNPMIGYGIGSAAGKAIGGGGMPDSGMMGNVIGQFTKKKPAAGSPEEDAADASDAGPNIYSADDMPAIVG